MKQFRLNPDRKYVSIIMEGIQKKDGHCPCRVVIDDTTFCPCDEFVHEGICKCKLYLPIEEANKKLEELRGNEAKDGQKNS